MTVPVAMIAAVAENGVIGSHNGLPWRIPSDFAYFKQMTLGKPLIMGRKTFEGIGKPLPGRINIVVTRQRGFQPDNVLVFDSLSAALDHAQSLAAAEHSEEVMIGGGAQIYAEAMPLADRLYISHVALAPEGDAWFPDIDQALWRVVEEPDMPPNPRDSAAFRVRVYRRRDTGSH